MDISEKFVSLEEYRELWLKYFDENGGGEDNDGGTADLMNKDVPKQI